MVKRSSNPTMRSAKGFTLVELILSMALLLVVTGAVFEQINQMQKKASSEAMKVDLSQQARDFVDQTVRDLHMSGYPSASMYLNQPDLTQVAKGLVSVSPTQMIFEGDLNSDGTSNISSVTISYVANDPNDPNCPCVRRSVVKKLFQDSLNEGQAGMYSSEATHVVPPGTGAGQSGEDLFAYYDQSGGVVPVGSGIDINSDPADLARIKTVKINLSLLNNQVDLTNNQFDRASISAVARVNQ